MRRLAGLVAAAALLGGCAVMDQMQHDVQGTQIRVDGKSYDEVWAAMTAAVEKHFHIKEANKETGIIVAYVPTFASWGDPWNRYPWNEAVTVFVTPTETNTVAYNFDVQATGYFTQQKPSEDWEPLLLKEVATTLGATAF